jgi:hypothetical protein
MSPQYNQQFEYTTSPWTEAYQSAAHHLHEQAESAAMMAQARFEDDTTQPTHDALSDIYNR